MTKANVDQLLHASVGAQRAGDLDRAEQVLREALTLSSEHPAALNSLGMIALARNRFADAEAFFRRAATADPNSPDLHLNVAKACRMQGDEDGERASLMATLAIEQRHFMALLRLAEFHQRREEHLLAVEKWNGVLALIAMSAERMPELDAIAARGGAYLAERRAVLAAVIDRGLAPAREAIPPGGLRRFDACMDLVLGRRSRVYANECEGLHYPFLPAEEYFDRSFFAWLEDLETQTAIIAAELEGMLAKGDEGFVPYVAMAPGTPENKWTPLDNSLSWGAMHLWRHGVRDERACARAPRTAEIMSRLPLADIPGRTPTVFFSLLKPRTHLPAHAGVSNIRATAHLPLIVPRGCRFRVGGDTRQWRVGEAWIFDDTIEHEAWNDSDEMRAVLIFDVWNPHLTPDECTLLRTFFATAGEEANDAGVTVSE